MGDAQYGVEDGHGEVELSYMVDRFNRLHRSEELPSGLMDNEWHISTRELDIDGVKVENVRAVFACTPDASYTLTSHFIKPATDKSSEIDTLIYHTLALFAGHGSGIPLNPRALFAPHTWSFDGDIGSHICSRLRELGLEQKSLLVVPSPTGVEETLRKANYSWGRWRDTTVQEWSNMRRREPALSYESCYNVGVCIRKPLQLNLNRATGFERPGPQPDLSGRFGLFFEEPLNEAE